MAHGRRTPPPEDGDLIFRRWRWHPQARQWMDAHKYGIKAWPMRVRRKR